MENATFFAKNRHIYVIFTKKVDIFSDIWYNSSQLIFYTH